MARTDHSLTPQDLWTLCSFNFRHSLSSPTFHLRTPLIFQGSGPAGQVLSCGSSPHKSRHDFHSLFFFFKIRKLKLRGLMWLAQRHGSGEEWSPLATAFPHNTARVSYWCSPSSWHNSLLALTRWWGQPRLSSVFPALCHVALSLYIYLFVKEG